MKIILSTRHEWLNLLFFPFKAYVVLACPFYFIFRAFCQQGSAATFDDLTVVFVFCLFALVIGSLIQLVVSGWEYALSSFIFVAVPVLFCMALHFLR
jgi:hypothetical protein